MTSSTAKKTAAADTPAVVEHATLSHALAAFQREVPTIRKGQTAKVTARDGGSSYSYDYADLSDVTEKALPLLGKHGLAFVTRPTMGEGQAFALAYELRHESGESIEGVYPLPNANTPAQTMGGAITYARRYVLCAVTGIAPGGDDDDAGALAQHQYGDRPAARPAASRPAAPPAPAERDWAAEAAQYEGDHTALTNIWQAARAAGAAVAVLDAIAKLGAAAAAAAVPAADAAPSVADAPADETAPADPADSIPSAEDVAAASA